MRKHELKTWPSFFAAVADGSKTFEVRFNDRDFAVGDQLCLREWDPPHGLACLGRYTGAQIFVSVTYVLPGGRFGIDASTVVMGITVVSGINKRTGGGGEPYE